LAQQLAYLPNNTIGPIAYQGKILSASRAILGMVFTWPFKRQIDKKHIEEAMA